MKTRTFNVVVDGWEIGKVTAAYHINEEGELKTGFSYCSPMEKHFNRKIGRERAIKRLQENDCVNMSIKYPHGCLPVLPFVKAMILADSRDRDVSWLKYIGVENLI